MYWPEHRGLAETLTARANGALDWPGLTEPAAFPMHLIVAPDRTTFDSITGGRIPAWGAGVAYPDTRTIVLRVAPDIQQVFTHELAHLTLREAVGRAPLWFEEGYASRAAGEWGRLETLRVNWALVRDLIPSLTELNRRLRMGAGSARASYGLATTAVVYLERLGREQGLGPILTALARTRSFDQALREAHGITLGQFEELWQRDVRRRHGWLLFATSFSVFWTVVAGVLLGLTTKRRKRNRVRRAALDEGWTLEGDDGIPSS